jgi:hypothetical protein
MRYSRPNRFWPNNHTPCWRTGPYNRQQKAKSGTTRRLDAVCRAGRLDLGFQQEEDSLRASVEPCYFIFQSPTPPARYPTSR